MTRKTIKAARRARALRHDAVQTLIDRVEAPKMRALHEMHAMHAEIERDRIQKARDEKARRERDTLIRQKYVKMLYRDMTHQGMKYKMGLNVDVLPFDPDANCKPGGLYFCRPEHVLDNAPSIYELIADVTLPDDAQVSAGRTKLKADRIILSNLRCLGCYLNGVDAPQHAPQVEHRSWAWALLLHTVAGMKSKIAMWK